MMKKNSKKVWIGFFIVYQFFISFVINCGEDQAYDRTQASLEDDGSEADDCDSNSFLTADCVEEVQADMDAADEDAEDEDAGDEADDGATS